MCNQEAIDTSPGETMEIGIVGGGIVGVILALGLIKQNIKVRVFEQAAGFREIGAGMAFSACARHCMDLMDPTINQALLRCGAVSVSDANDEDDYLRWIDGYNQHRPEDPAYQRPLAQIGGAGFRGCRRDQFLEELAKEVPQGVVEFRKRLDNIEENIDNGTVVLNFADGTSAEVDAVIGCDGIKSTVRKQIFGPGHPASYAQYTHKVAYRGLVPMSRAVEILGAWKANNFHHHIGPGAHLTHYPVASHTMLNVVIFLSDPNPWPDSSRMEEEGSREDVLVGLEGWHPTVLSLVRLLPEKLSKWALFDLGEFPAPSYCAERVCIAGDAAHASSPHHGASACLGVEDALCLNILLAKVRETVAAQQDSGSDHVELGHALQTAFQTFDSVRRKRTQWLVNSSRRVCDLYHQTEWANPTRWAKAETCFEEIRDRSYKIWQFDIDGMVKQTLDEYKARLRDVKLAIVGGGDGVNGARSIPKVSDDKHGYNL